MKLTRRLFLFLLVGFLAHCRSFRFPFSGPKKVKWHDLCHYWMQCLIPDDDQGPGVDCPQVWDLLNSKIKSDPTFANWLEQGFSLSGCQKVPQSDLALREFLSQNNPEAQFISRFFDILIELYYGCEVGWQDLGFTQPPQPRGYTF